MDRRRLAADRLPCRRWSSLCARASRTSLENRAIFEREGRIERGLRAGVRLLEDLKPLERLTAVAEVRGDGT
ncbi:hypothetical protein [Agromyces sp. NPDC049794]|uniref:hypothetical protein n=1 Tax=unclassified Agromyces TaxID=2639701 RepID=UPI0033C7DE92